MEVLKIEDSKEVTDTESLSIARAGSDSENKELIRSNIPVNGASLESIKYEKKVKKEENNSYDTEISIKAENIDMRDKVFVEEHESSYEQLKSMKTDDYKIDCSNEYMQYRTSQCLSNKLEANHGQYFKYLETSKHEQNVEKEDTSDDMEKQNAVSKYQHNCFKYETGDTAVCSKNKTNTELCQPLLPMYKAKNKSVSQTDNKVTLEADARYFKCQFCDFITKYLKALKMHFTRKHSENAEVYKCFSCQYRTKDKSCLVRHCELQHNERTKWHQCLSCNFKTKYKHSLLQHHSLKHDDTAESFHCKVCDFKTKTRQHLIQHHRAKHDSSTKTFHCALCEFETKYKNNLLAHHRSKHDDSTKTFHCEICGYKTKYKGNLLKHHRSQHNGSAETFHCEICSYKTKYRKLFLRHDRLKHQNSDETLH